MYGGYSEALYSQLNDYKRLSGWYPSCSLDIAKEQTESLYQASLDKSMQFAGNQDEKECDTPSFIHIISA